MQSIVRALFLGLIILSIIASEAFAQTPEYVVMRNGQALEFDWDDAVSPDPHIVVAEGQTVLVINRGGSVISVDGPYSGPLSAAVQRPPNSLMARIGRLLGQSRWSTTWGGTRSGLGAGEGPHLPPQADILDISISRTTNSSRQCVARTGSPRVWRSAVGRTQLAVLSAPGQPATNIRFEPSALAASWPTFMPLIDDALYYAAYPDGSLETQTFRVTKISAPRSPSELVRVLVAEGCIEQASLAMERLVETRSSHNN